MKKVPRMLLSLVLSLLAAFIVLVMKGPAFVADAYPLDELDTLESTPGKGPR